MPTRAALLFDTGLGSEHAEFDQLLAPVSRRPLADSLAEDDRKVDDIDAIITCHLHYDHCGGNSLFPGIPTFVQAREFEGRGDLNWYIPDRVEFEAADLRLVDGEEEVAPGIRVVPTPGHTPGHQSLVIHDNAGPVILAGQAAYTTAEFADPEAEPARGFTTAWNGTAFLQSIRLLRGLNPQRVYFAHDAEFWAAQRRSRHSTAESRRKPRARTASLELRGTASFQAEERIWAFRRPSPAV